MSRVLAGRRSVLEALRGKTEIRRIFVEPKRLDEEIRKAAELHGVALAHRDRAELDRLSEGARHQGVVALAEDYAFCDLDALLDQDGSPVALVALDQVTDPQNLGAIIHAGQ